METWDLYTAEGQKTGRTMTRGEKVPEGYFHLVCDVLVQHTDGTYLLMKRCGTKRVYPGWWEASAGGSVLAGEGPLEGARRELREETGIEDASWTFLGMEPRELYRSIHYSYLAVTDCPKDAIVFQEGETEDYRWVSRDEFKEFANSPNMIPTTKRRMLPWLKEMGYLAPEAEVPLTAAELTDVAICPTCYDRSHNHILYGDPAETTLYENDLFTCVLIGGPRALGHTCIISKEHFKDMMEIPDDLCAAVYFFAKKAMKALKQVYGAESVYLCTMCDGPMNHFHVQLIPRYACEKRGSRNFVKPRQEYIHQPEKVEALRQLLR